MVAQDVFAVMGVPATTAARTCCGGDEPDLLAPNESEAARRAAEASLDREAAARRAAEARVAELEARLRGEAER